MPFFNNYTDLGDAFFQYSEPTQKLNPQLFLWNSVLAKTLPLDDIADVRQKIEQIFSGNQALPGVKPMALAYAGHQFGYFSPSLGDGRAHLIGQYSDAQQHCWDVQLKGSGRTPYSRRGDGFCALGPAIREFIMSEAMHTLGVPTARSLAVVATGESVYRQDNEAGAVITRIASSHIRIGSFQYFAAQEKNDKVKSLCDYTIKRHFPHLLQSATASDDAEKYMRFIDAVIERQINLVCHWMRVGFIHGVMNTDNCALSGETIDFGPCAMMGVYDPTTVFSSIDEGGRYAFGQQAEMMQWNLARLADCFIGLVDQDPERSVELLTPLIVNIQPRFKQAFTAMMGEKLGFSSIISGDEKLIEDLLVHMHQNRCDYTVSFNALTEGLMQAPMQEQAQGLLGEHYAIWAQRVESQNLSLEQCYALMRKANPAVIPRNHQLERVIKTCLETRSNKAAEDFLAVLSKPYQSTASNAAYQVPAADGDKYYQTFCGT